MEEKNKNLTDEQLSQQLRKSKGGKLGGMLLSLLGGVIAQQIQALREIKVLLLLFVALQMQLGEEGIPGERLVQRVEKAAVFRVIQQRIQRCPNSFRCHSHEDAPCAGSIGNR